MKYLVQLSDYVYHCLWCRSDKPPIFSFINIWCIPFLLVFLLDFSYFENWGFDGGIWTILFQVPAVHLVGDIMFFPNEFLLRRIPHLNKIVDKKQRQAVESSKEQYLTNCNQNLVRWEKINSLFLIIYFQIRFGTSLQLIGWEYY